MAVQKRIALGPVDGGRIRIAGDVQKQVERNPDKLKGKRQTDDQREPQAVLRPSRVGERGKRDSRLDEEPPGIWVQSVQVPAGPVQVLGQNDPAAPAASTT